MHQKSFIHEFTKSSLLCAIYAMQYHIHVELIVDAISAILRADDDWFYVILMLDGSQQLRDFWLKIYILLVTVDFAFLEFESVNGGFSGTGDQQSGNGEQYVPDNIRWKKSIFTHSLQR